MPNFGQLKKIDLRKVWAHEASNFTPWLAKNIKALGESLGMELELQKQEASVGDFSLDLLAQDLGTGSLVIIENQLTETDHNHLGKLLTYTGGFDARVIIWIAESIRDEHRQALEWLNQNTGSNISFFGVVIEVVQIDDSKPAYNFKPIVYPNEWRKRQRLPGGYQTSPRAENYRKFFQQLLDELREKHRFTGARKGQPQSWYAFSSGVSGIGYSVSFTLGNRVRTELYIDTGDKEENKSLFDWLLKDSDAIEAEYGSKFEWDRLDEKQACRIAIYREGSIEGDTQALDSIRLWAIENLMKFKSVFGLRIKKYKHKTI
ncbi:MAG: hypothetical protein A3F83_07025 [Candidatus Glassbacteria bacterium RIFCSPLOWO2_12_FULL_58_11]|uniref:DUF4268 domain-containing protein n=1 Tax=Candidatus Glassbacteria bacterium RIFCSPLOWO2_12_FULL_58_11 TaxID=1817867 RepID=A0A1F5YT21_9BACT|nr:MAG: hypothetical protein A3F83_07025 [Candidatus Glassbacteria bacterium RIFCSPLOWO2_12_FULL_58_11]